MLNVAMVLMILAGVFGLPAAACSTACAGMMGAAANSAAHDPSMKSADAVGMATIGVVFLVLGIVASIGSIVMGALVKKIGKAKAGIAAFALALVFCLLLLQANPLGIPSALMLIVAGVMIFVAPAPEFRDVTKIEVSR